MTNRSNGNPFRTYRTALAAALVLALSSAHSANEVGSSNGEVPPRLPHNIVPVTKCTDDLTAGTLRWAVANASNADTIDLSALACSTITLNGVSGAITAAHDFIYLKGPTDHELTIDGAFNSRVFVHVGVGKMEISNLTIANGHNSDDASPDGGCLFSESSIVLRSSRVTNCSLAPMTSNARGGAVASMGTLFFYDSTIELSYAASVFVAQGGGAWAHGDVRAFNSVIDSNSIAAPFGSGGGLFTSGSATIISSTISRNAAGDAGAGGMALYGSQGGLVSNSTISQNTADHYGGLETQAPITISNSTIAFNNGGFGGGVSSVGAALTIQSSIIAENSLPSGGGSDIEGINGALLSAASGRNLIIASSLALPMDTIRQCAKLEPLAHNGGSTMTHGLAIGSSAIDKGGDGGLMFDQRGFARTAGSVADIGAVERQPGEIDERLLANGFEVETCPP
jgi:hypothetical protein